VNDTPESRSAELRPTFSSAEPGKAAARADLAARTDTDHAKIMAGATLLASVDLSCE